MGFEDSSHFGFVGLDFTTGISVHHLDHCGHEQFPSRAPTLTTTLMPLSRSLPNDISIDFGSGEWLPPALFVEIPLMTSPKLSV
jgi:hypothetical protein